MQLLRRLLLTGLMLLCVNVVIAQDYSHSFLEINVQSTYPSPLPADSLFVFWKDGVMVEPPPAEIQTIQIQSGVWTKERFYLLVQKRDDPAKTLELWICTAEGETLERYPSAIPSSVRQSAMEVQGDGLDDCLFVFGGRSQGIAQKFNLKTKQWTDLTAVLSRYPDMLAIQGNNTAKALGNSSLLFLKREPDPSDSRLWQTRFGIYNTITQAYFELEKSLAGGVIAIIDREESQFKAIVRDASGENKVGEFQFVSKASGFVALDVMVLALYFIMMLVIGFYFSKRQKTADDYFKAGKRIPFWAAGLSILGTGLSAITFMAVPAKTFATDWAYFVNRAPSIFVALMIGLLYIPVFRALDVSTAYEYLQKRFNLATRLIGSTSFILFQLGRIGVVLFLPALVLNVVTGFDVIHCIILTGLVSLVYTILGGIEAVIWTDVIQVIILYGGIFLCVAFIALELNDGVGEIVATGQAYDKFKIFNMHFNLQDPNFWVVVFGSFFTNLTSYGSDQAIVQRYMTTKTRRGAVKSIWLNIFIGLFFTWVFFFMGTALFAFYQDQPQEMLHTMAANDAVFPWYIISQLPHGISGLLIAGIFAAAMSSLSSSMNSGATAYTMDFHRLFRREFNAVRVGRIVTMIFGIGGILFAILFATLEVKSIWDEFLKIIGLLTGGLGGVFLLGIITTRANGPSALVGLLGSAIIQFFVARYQPFNLMLFTASGFISCFVIGYLSSYLFPGYHKDLEGLTIFTVSKED